MVYTGNEHFIVGGNEIGITMTDFWQWSYPNFLSKDRRSVLSKFIIASSVGLSGTCPQDDSDFQKPYDILTQDGYRIQVESASYLQSADGEHPSHISFPIPVWDVDVYIFCLYKATSASQNPLDLGLWDFFSMPASVFSDRKPKSVTLPRLMDLGVWQCDYYGIADGIRKTMDV